MTKHIRTRAPQIAQEFVGLWQAHTDALEHAGLPYIDNLIGAAMMAEPLRRFQLELLLMNMIPKMQYGTARRLIDLKYPDLQGGDFPQHGLLN